MRRVLNSLLTWRAQRLAGGPLTVDLDAVGDALAEPIAGAQCHAMVAQWEIANAAAMDAAGDADGAVAATRRADEQLDAAFVAASQAGLEITEHVTPEAVIRLCAQFLHGEA